MQSMNTDLQKIVERLLEVRDDVDAIDHHQTDRIVGELESILGALQRLCQDTDS